MAESRTHRLTGEARPKDAAAMLRQIEEHFEDHGTLTRTDTGMILENELGLARFELQDGAIRIALQGPSHPAIQRAVNTIAEHLYYFAGDEPLELHWSETQERQPLPNLHPVTVVSAHDVTPHMRRVSVVCDDVSTFVGAGAGMHVRVLVPPKGREPVWPGFAADGRIAWPTGEDELLVRVYTIRAVDEARRELHLDFFQHPEPGIETPGADFARHTRSGDRIALIGPGGGAVPQTPSILMIGDESALPAIARIAAEAPAETRLKAIVEVIDESEEQAMPTRASLDLDWLHRHGDTEAKKGTLAGRGKAAILAADPGTFVWIACEKKDLRTLRTVLRQRDHDRKLTYAAWYWERQGGARAR